MHNLKFNIHFFSTGGETRTPDTWFWRPVLYRLSYTRILRNGSESANRFTNHFKVYITQ